MKAKLLDQNGERTYAVVFDTGDEFVADLTSFAKEQRLDASHFTAIGAFSDATLGFFEIERKDYKTFRIVEQVEVLSLVGDIALDNGEPKIHAHVVVGKSDGTTRGGHLFAAHVRPTLEVVVVESPPSLRRTFDEASGLALINL